jgi:hypothetical protein
MALSLGSGRQEVKCHSEDEIDYQQKYTHKPRRPTAIRDEGCGKGGDENHHHCVFHRVNFAPQFFVRRKHLRQAHKRIHANPELNAGSSRQIRIGTITATDLELSVRTSCEAKDLGSGSFCKLQLTGPVPLRAGEIGQTAQVRISSKHCLDDAKDQLL